MKKFNLKGFTLIELMIVVAIIAFLAMIAVPNFMKYVSKAKRSEVYLHLGAIYAAQKAYWAEHGTYSSSLTDLGWSPDGETNYTYGFPGSADVNHKIGKLKAPASELGIAKADKDSFVAAAVADIDGDGKLDIITVNEKREIKIVSDDLV
ncbi:MAG: prepilin-type N-terminal cleavage/methylation domain-containing protein [Candidatus Babeliales bacterium]|nr:prepilin-type N-terminal cleavage/methylation domain-containing protein [Candidatus Babeliales bacterium]